MRDWNAGVFETAELGRSVGKQEFEAQVPKLRKAGVPVIVLLAGADGVGKGETVKRVLEWLDARGLRHPRLRPSHRRGARELSITRILDHLGLSPPPQQELPPPHERVQVPVDDEGREILAG